MLRDLPNHLVALVVTKGVIDVFEVVQVNEQDGKLGISLFLLDVCLKCPVVGQACELVFVQEILEFFFSFANGADVRKNRNMALTFALVIQQR